MSVAELDRLGFVCRQAICSDQLPEDLLCLLFCVAPRDTLSARFFLLDYTGRHGCFLPALTAWTSLKPTI